MSFNKFMASITFPTNGICDSCNINIGTLGGKGFELGFNEYICRDCEVISLVEDMKRDESLIKEHNEKLKEALQYLKEKGVDNDDV